MTTTIDLAAKPSLDELLALAAAGSDVVLVQGGKPVATLSAAKAEAVPDMQKPRVGGQQPGAIIFLSDAWDDPLPDEFWLSGDP
jgi:antitoxin (DNA-binding transcriptional repressor) of toxin-antitoxin stability system